ncbi:hypothetical protein IT409_01020 [Candidatus Falkowbacteria bacterium]|nr:hypothetical protein [Candidatus Falkowbacteria bacterium]
MNEHRRYAPRLIVPSVRGGSNDDPANIAAWSGKFSQAYEALFTYLVPDECMTFLRAISVPEQSFTINDIRDIKRNIITGKQKLIAGKHFRSRIENTLIDVDEYEEQVLHPYLKLMRHNNVHHILPQSVGGLRVPENEVQWPVGFHDLYHRMFENMTLDQIEVFLALINSSYVAQKGMYMRQGNRLINVSCRRACTLRKLIKQYGCQLNIKAA